MTSPKDVVEHAPVELPTERATALDPPPELTELREQQPMCPLRFPDGHVGWLGTSFELAREILGDARFSMRPSRPPLGDREGNKVFQDRLERETPEMETGDLLALDPPEHARLRRLLAGHFTVRRVREHGAAIEAIVEKQLDAMERSGAPADLVEELALPIPSLSVCEILGVPAEDREAFERPAKIHQDLSAGHEERFEALRDLLDYAKSKIAEKRREPGDDLLSYLIADGKMSDEELAGATVVLFDAGHGTTASMIALGTFALLEDRSQWEYLRTHPDAIDGAVEELLRYLTVFQLGSFTRTATEDADFGAGTVREGESVIVSLGAANRDPDRFPDPNRLDVCRDAAGHVAFGHGRHMCLGQHLARLELKITFTRLVARMPNLRLAVPAEEIEMPPDHILYGPESLPVEW